MMVHIASRRSLAFISCAGLVAAASHAGPAQASLAVPSGQTAAVVSGERLSDWLLRNQALVSGAGFAHWRVPAEAAQQALLRKSVLDQLTELEFASRDTPLTQLIAKLEAMPVTGRVSLFSDSARWLQATPSLDPVLNAGHNVYWYHRSTTVAVLSESGVVCMLEHDPEAQISEYLQACGLDKNQVETVQLAQPDGRLISAGVADWNASSGIAVAPGAWVLAPSKGIFSASLAHEIGRFLATQPPVYPNHASGASALVLSNAERSRPVTSPQYTASDWGEIGLIQTPTARMEAAGALRSHISSTVPYTSGTIMLQPLDWLEAGFRYTDISTALYGPTIAGSQTYKDKSIDFKLRLLPEGRYLPQVAVGVRDIGGTGLFSGEYLVANKRWNAFDFSLGLGWGYLGGRSDIASPLSFLGSGFNTRNRRTSVGGGTVNEQSLFRGDAAVFGGMQWTSPSHRWVIKTELDGNNYQSEPFGSTLRQDSPINFGAVYRYSPHIDLMASLERGNRASLGVTFHLFANRLETPKPLDPILPRLVQTKPAPPFLQGEMLADELSKHTGWKVLSLEVDPQQITLDASTDQIVFLKERVSKAIRVLHDNAPDSIRNFVLNLQERGLPMSRIEVNRAEWLLAHTQETAPSLRLPNHYLYASPMAPAAYLASEESTSQSAYRATTASNELEIAPSYSQILGGPDGFLLFQAGVQAKWEAKLQSNTWFSGSLNARLVDNYQGFKYDAPSNLPRVRTYAREYVTNSNINIPVLQLTHVEALGGGHYASLYGGLLESMYAGAGGEWLYRPWQGRLALGVDINRVRQRGFAQDFSLRDYEVSTGHATAYWDTGWNDIQLKLQAGRYLAGDVGATFDIKRVFPNGTAFGAWVTRTNVSAAQFGEGSFDKGIYITIPFDLLLPKSAAGKANVLWTPLTRDGGARLNRSVSLFDLTSQRDPRAMTIERNPPGKPDQ